MSIFSKLFGGGGGAAPEAQPETHEGFRIFPEPVKEGTHWRVAARIEKEVGGEVLTHHLIRADTLASQDEAAAASVNKARQMIDEQGERIFR